MRITKFSANWDILKNTSLAIMLALSSHALAQTSSNCQALVVFQNDLWFVKQDGAPLLRLTRDGNEKYAAALSPDGKTIAYNSSESGQKVTLIDANGGNLANVDVNATSAIEGVDWLTSNLLRVEEHLNPNNSTFHFVIIPTAIKNSTLFKQLPTAKGRSCTPSPKHKRIACVLGGVFVNGQHTYSLTSSFTSATILHNITLSGGSVATTLTDPPFNLEMVEISGDRVGLKVTAPDGFSKLQYVSPGGTMSFSLADDDIVSPVYGFSPTITDKKRRIVNVRVLKSKTGHYSLEGGVAWDPHGRRIAIVEANDVGQRSLIILNRQRSDDDDDNREENESSNVDGRIMLPIAGPISSIEFTSDKHIRVTGSSQVFEQDIPAHGPIPAGSSYTVTLALPKQLTVTSGMISLTVPVQGWVCH